MARGDAMARVERALKAQGRALVNGRSTCPAHNGKGPNLAVEQGAKGAVLTCHSRNCTFEEIAAAIGLTTTELFDRPVEPKQALRTAIPEHGASGPVSSIAPERQQHAEYIYHDEHGNQQLKVCRQDTVDSADKNQKRIWQCHLDGHGAWHNGKGSVPPLLYQLPAVLRAVRNGQTVIIVEGEKCAELLAAADPSLCVTTSAGGAGSWCDEHAAWLKHANAKVVVFPDNDQPGYGYARSIISSLIDDVQSLKLVRLSGLPEKGDIADWLALGNSVAELLRIIESTPEASRDTIRQLDELCAGTGNKVSLDDRSAFRPLSLVDIAYESRNQTEGIATGFDALDRLGVQWRAGCVSAVVGRPGSGKTTFLVNAACNVLENDTSSTVVFVTYEEDRKAIADRFINCICARFGVATSAVELLAHIRDAGTDAPEAHNPELTSVIARLNGILARLTVVDGDRLGNDSVSVLNTLAEMMRSSSNSAPTLVVLDYFQKLRVGESARSSSRQQELQLVSDNIRRFSKGEYSGILDTRFECAVLVGAQVTRDGNEHPRADRIREADDLLNDASTVLCISKSEGAGRDSAILRVTVDKHRHGETSRGKTSEISWDLARGDLARTSFGRRPLRSEIVSPTLSNESTAKTQLTVRPRPTAHSTALAKQQRKTCRAAAKLSPC